MIMVVRLLHYFWLLIWYCSCYTTTPFMDDETRFSIV